MLIIKKLLSIRYQAIIVLVPVIVYSYYQTCMC